MAANRERRRIYAIYGDRYAPDPERNVRHGAVWRKSTELHPVELLQDTFGLSSKKLTVGMGTNYTHYELGTIKGHIEVEVVFKNKGNDYAIRHAAALPLLQAAEQAFHDFVVPFRAARGMGPHSESALEPLPGLQRVVTVLPAAAPLVRAAALVPIAGPPPAQTPPSTPLGRRRYTQFPGLPSPPTSSADNSPSPASPPPTSSPARSSSAGPSSARNIIDLTHIDDDDEPRAHPANKRNFVHLGTIELTDDEDEDARPHKKAKFGY
ncbi:hypothetical protein C8F04DRAFT_1266135 [Mycena alexandri]|uniref:Uncharacterized protein n=1 Tax=Mycena alexandri TaxID=1745969 RepID=A0AAD6SJU3_9AGAR|nr:hypothetical protein C8F04DRAFT_1266135 [Mycena alexandri]